MNSALTANIEMLIRKKRGFDFEAFINKLHLIIYGVDGYQPSRERKDNGADGVLIATRTIVAAYGPDTLNYRNISKKVSADFDLYLDKWAFNYPGWAIFCNQSLSPDLLMLANVLRKTAAERNVLVESINVMGIEQIVHLIETTCSEKQLKLVAHYLGINKDLYWPVARQNFAEKIWEPHLNIQTLVSNSKYELDYRVRMTDFFGRDVELKTLQDFLNEERKFSWWMIIGSGGMGKSRLSMEICLEYIEQFSNSGFYTSFDASDAWENFSATRPTLIVIDYASFQLKTIEHIIEILSDSANSSKLICKVRLLLLDRELSQEWELIKRANIKVRSTHYTEDLMPLKLQSSRSLSWAIIDQFIKKNAFDRYEKVKGEQNKILDDLHEIDPQYRPLFAFFSAIAII